MRQLPNLPNRGSGRLPLAEDSAARLAEALVEPSVEARTAIVGPLLAGDPSLALWGTCASADFFAAPLRSLAPLADWFARRAVHYLAWSADSPFAAAPSPAERRQTAELAARSVATAHLAKHLSTSPESASRAELIGLLHAADVWFAGDPAALPPWIADAIKQIKSGQIKLGEPGDHDVQCVVEAIELLDGSRPATKSTAKLLDQANALGEATRRRWRRRPSELAEILPNICRQIAKLTTLSDQFDEALQLAKLSAMKELAYGAGHEINNPLANISTRAQTMLRDETDPERKRMLATINRQAFRAHEMIADMMLFARPPEPQFERCDAAELAARVIAEIRPAADVQQTLVALDVDAGAAMIDADPTQLEVAVRAACLNSLEALGGGGSLCVSVRRLQTEEGDAVEIVVADDGPGLGEREREHLFDPFFSGREAGRGLGFGLSKCWRIVANHGGRIDVESQPGAGATLKIILAAAEEPVDEE